MRLFDGWSATGETRFDSKVRRSVERRIYCAGWRGILALPDSLDSNRFQKRPQYARGSRGTDRGNQEISKVTGLLIMKTTIKTIDSAGQVADDRHERDPHSHDRDDDNHAQHGHDHETGTAEYVSLATSDWLATVPALG